jgi:hypothetical protein
MHRSSVNAPGYVKVAQKGLGSEQTRFALLLLHASLQATVAGKQLVRKELHPEEGQHPMAFSED